MILNANIYGSGVSPSGTMSIAANGTYDVTAFAEAVVNVSGGGISVDDIAGKTLSGIVSGSTIYISAYAFYSYTNLVKASFPACTTIGSHAFDGCTRLTEASFPVCASITSYAFYSCSYLSKASFPACTRIGSNAFRDCFALTEASFPVCAGITSYAFYSCRNLISLNLGAVSSVPTLGPNVFFGTPIGGNTTSTGGVYGSVYVPASLYESFLTATNWSSISARIVSVP